MTHIRRHPFTSPFFPPWDVDVMTGTSAAILGCKLLTLEASTENDVEKWKSGFKTTVGSAYLPKFFDLRGK